MLLPELGSGFFFLSSSEPHREAKPRNSVEDRLAMGGSGGWGGTDPEFKQTNKQTTENRVSLDLRPNLVVHFLHSLFSSPANTPGPI